MTAVTLVRPSEAELSEYVAALSRGWSPDNVREAETAREHLDAIAADAGAFLSSLDDPDGKGAPFLLPDGSLAQRLPGFIRWIWDGAFCGSIGLRWQRGTPALPANVLGHIGFAVVPWKRRMGCAKQALALLLPEARAAGLPFVELTTDPDNVASQRVIAACGGRLIGRFRKPDAYGNAGGLRFRIDLDPNANRKRWMAVLARASAAQIEACLGDAPALPPHAILRGPEMGLAMVRGRAGGSGAAFNLGEMTVARCTVRNEDGRVGHAYVAGRDLRHAELAAAIDAVMQDPARREALERAVIAKLAAAQDAARADTAARAAATRVEFFTMANMRG